MLTFGQERPTAAVLTFTDVTEELATVEAVAASDTRFRNLAVFAAGRELLEADAAGRWTYANRRWTEFTGSGLSTVGDDGWLVDSAHLDDRSLAADAWWGALDGGYAFTREVRHRRPDGRTVPVQMEATPVRDDAGRVVGWLGTATDLTVQFAAAACSKRARCASGSWRSARPT